MYVYMYVATNLLVQNFDTNTVRQSKYHEQSHHVDIKMR